MKLQELITIMQNRLITLNEARKSASAAGDLERVTQIDNDLLTTSISIDQIKRMLDTSIGS
jgi:hypothetical protein